jgi:hypothetical protein
MSITSLEAERVIFGGGKKRVESGDEESSDQGGNGSMGHEEVLITRYPSPITHHSSPVLWDNSIKQTNPWSN